MNQKFCYYLFLVFAGLGIYFGITIFLIFTFYYHNDSAGAFGLISGLFAAISLHLKLLEGNNRLAGWYSPNNLKSISFLGLIFFLISIAMTLFYIITAYIQHIPMMPVKDSYYLIAVWSAMTAKWSLTVSILSYRYARVLQYTTPFLIIQNEE